MSDFDELMRVYGLDERMFALGRLSKKERDKSRKALTDAISAVTSERDEAKNLLDDMGKRFDNANIENEQLEAQLKEANEDASTLNLIVKVFYPDKLPESEFKNDVIAALEIHRARLAKDGA